MKHYGRYYVLAALAGALAAWVTNVHRVLNTEVVIYPDRCFNTYTHSPNIGWINLGKAGVGLCIFDNADFRKGDWVVESRVKLGECHAVKQLPDCQGCVLGKVEE